jgi:tetratricopeptide (TPR) repeat protein
MLFIRFLSTLLIALLLVSPTLSAQNTAEWKAQLKSADKQQQIGALHQLVILYQNINLDTALLYSYEALRLSQEVADDSLVGVSHSRLSTSFYHLRQMDSLLVHAKAAEKIGARLTLNKMHAFSLKMQGIGYNYQGDFAKATESNQKALEVYQTMKDSVGIAATYSNLGRIYQKSAQYDEALRYFIKAEKLFEQSKDVNGQSITAAQIGDLFLDMEAPTKAISYLKKALELTSRDSLPIQYGDLLNSLGSIYHQEKVQLDSAQFCFMESLKLFEEVGDQQGVAISNNNLGNIYRDQKEWQKAFSHYHTSRHINLKNQWLPGLAENAKNLGIYHQLKEQQDSAIHYFLIAYDISEEIELAFREEAILESIYRYYKQNEQPAEALFYFEKLTALIEETKGEAVQKEIAALETKYETEKKALRIKSLELQSSLAQSKARALIIGLVSLMILFGLGIAGVFYRRRKEQQLFALKQKMHEQEKKELDQELTYKTKQLTSHALHMVQKNKVLQELKRGITDLVSVTADAQNKKAMRSLVRRIDFNIQSDEDWDTFKLYFEQTNQNFYQNLAKINKDLTGTELKLCSLIKLNLNIKETASVLNIEPTSVKTARHRLRKKLNLEQGQDLTSFIRQVA